MKAVIYEEFKSPPVIREVADPRPAAGGVVLEVKACGICRSDWHGWMGNDPDIVLPHVPGHELSGVIVETGTDVRNRQKGERVTVPFVSGCGRCPTCLGGDQQICDRQFQPGFTAWGAFAEYVAIDYADTNLVPLPDELDFVTASSLGCRFVTSFRALAHQAAVAGGEWVAVWGAGGVGLSAVMIADALGANAIAIDIRDEKLAFAEAVGAAALVNAERTDPVEAVREITGGGADVSVEALGHPEVFFNSISCLKKRGRHIQVGIMEAGEHRAAVPVDLIIARELEIKGSHGMAAHKYPEMFGMIRRGKLRPEKLIGRTVSLEEAGGVLTSMDKFSETGVTVIDDFS